MSTVRVTAPSRLHFGLFALPGDTSWPDLDGNPTVPARAFGGVGLMVDGPGVQVAVSPAATWSAAGPAADRALTYAQVVADAFQLASAFQVTVERCAPEHAGLGTGTQLGLAIARAVTVAAGLPDLSPDDLAGLLGRGARSALGVHGFARGGFLVEGGKAAPTALAPAPLLFRHALPFEWGVLLVLPKDLRGVHGPAEVEAFAQLARTRPDGRQTDALCRLALLGMMPAVLEGNLDAFGEALYDFNRRAGELFRPAQGGVYSHPQVEAVVRALRQAKVKGVGQSSWGPAVFAVCPLTETGELTAWLRRTLGLGEDEVMTTVPSEDGATLRVEDGA